MKHWFLAFSSGSRMCSGSNFAFYFYSLDNNGIPPTPKMIEDYANQTPRRNTPDGEHAARVGNALVYQFIKRLPKPLQLIMQSPVDKSCLTSSDIGLQTAWFDQLEIAMQKHPITQHVQLRRDWFPTRTRQASKGDHTISGTSSSGQSKR